MSLIAKVIEKDSDFLTRNLLVLHYGWRELWTILSAGIPHRKIGNKDECSPNTIV